MAIAPSSLATVVLVHGAWADGSSWGKVIGLLQAEGFPVIAVQNPTTSLSEDLLATRRVLDAVDGPIVLAGHSWGGTVITEAGDHPMVKALVYVAALAPDVGQSSGELVADYPAQPAMSGVGDDGSGQFKMSVESWIANVAQDVAEAEARILSAVQTPLGPSSFSDKVSKAAWSVKPCWYVISTMDRALSVEMQRDLASKLNAKTTEVDSSHMSLFSNPSVVAAAIKEAAYSACTASAKNTTNRPRTI